MKKRLLAIVVAMILVLSLPLSFSGCGKQEAASPSGSAASGDSSSVSSPETSVAKTGEKITVILPKHEMDTVGFHEEMTRKFEQETGIEVELINESWENVADSVMTDLTAGGGAYDVIEFDNAWVQKFYDNDWLTPLNDYASDEIMNGMLPGLIDKFSVDGNLYGIAWNNDTRFFMYNTKMLKDAGFDAPPETWTDLVDMSKTIQSKGIAPYGYIDSYMNQQTGSNEITFLVYSFGGKLFDDKGNPVMATDAKTKAAFEFLVNEMNTDKIVDPGSLTADYETAANVFCTGGSAFMLQAWPGVYSLANDPESSSIVDQIGVADTAVHADGAQQVVLTLPEAMAIPKTSQHKDAAWKYIEYMSSKEFDKQRAETIGALPIWTDLFSDPDLLAKYPYWKNFAGQISSSQGLPNLTWYDEYSNVLMTETQKMLLGQTSVDDGLKSIQDQCVALQKENS